MIKLITKFYKYQITNTIFCTLDFKNDVVDLKIYDIDKLWERTLLKLTLPVNKTLQPIDYVKMYYADTIRKNKEVHELFGF